VPSALPSQDVPAVDLLPFDVRTGHLCSGRGRPC
jgi:hypothetical protein